MNDKGRQWSDSGLLKVDNIVMCVFVCAIIFLQLRTLLSLCVFSSLAQTIKRSCSVPSVFLQCSCWPAGTKVRGSNPEGKWKAYKHSCFATSLKCAGNPQEIMVCSRWGAVFLWWDFAGCATDAECCRAFQQANDTMWVFTLRSFYNNTICAMVCLCV